MKIPTLSEIKTLARQVVSNAIEFTRYTRSTEIGVRDQVAGYPREGSGDKEYDNVARRMQHFGTRSRPPKDTPAIRVSVGSSVINSAIIAEDPGERYGPDDLEEGETALYNIVEDCIVKLLKSGAISITTKNGEVLSLQGGDRGVVLKDMHAKAGTFTFTFNNGGGPSSLSITYVDPDGKPTLLPMGSGNVDVSVLLDEGSDKTKSG